MTREADKTPDLCPCCPFKMWGTVQHCVTPSPPLHHVPAGVGGSATDPKSAIAHLSLNHSAYATSSSRSDRQMSCSGASWNHSRSHAAASPGPDSSRAVATRSHRSQASSGVAGWASWAKSLKRFHRRHATAANATSASAYAQGAKTIAGVMKRLQAVTRALVAAVATAQTQVTLRPSRNLKYGGRPLERQVRRSDACDADV